MKNSVIGILSLCFGLLGFFTAYWYIGIIPCVVAIILGIIGLMDYLAYKWSSVMGLICSALGIALLIYTIVTDIGSGRLIIAYERGDFVYVTNVDEADDTWNSFADILADAELKAAQDRDSAENRAASSVAAEGPVRDSSADNTVVVDRTSAGRDNASADSDSGETVPDGYEKGTNYGTYWESQWLGMRYDPPGGFEIMPDEQLEQLMQLGNAFASMFFEDDDIGTMMQNSVYELMAASPSGDVNFSLSVEQSDESIDSYMQQLEQQLQAMYGSTLIEAKGFEGTTEIGGKYFEKYSFVEDNNGSVLNQTYYMMKKGNRLVYIVLTYPKGSSADAAALLGGFSEL